MVNNLIRAQMRDKVASEAQKSKQKQKQEQKQKHYWKHKPKTVRENKQTHIPTLSEQLLFGKDDD